MAGPSRRSPDSGYVAGDGTSRKYDSPLTRRPSPGLRVSPSPVHRGSHSPHIADSHENSQKRTVDWHVEGPGRRVGYDNLTAIDWIFEYTKERQRVRRLLSNSHGLTRNVKQLVDASHVWIVLVTTGVAIGCVAAVISIASDWLGDIKIGYCKATSGSEQFYLSRQFCCWGHDDVTHCQDWTPWRKAFSISSAGGGYVVEYIFFIWFSILFAVTAAFLVRHYSIYAKQSGIPEIKTLLGGFVIRRFLGGWTLVTKSFGICLAVSSGLWLGKEGPLVHLACCCANIIMKPFESLRENEARKRELLSAAAASGISVAFGSPIGGVLFSLEQLSYYFPDKTMWQSFVCAMVAALTLRSLNPFHTGQIVLYEVKLTTNWHSFEILPFVVLGIAGGIYGGVFIKLNMLIARLRRADSYPLRDRKVLEVLIVATITALINFPNTFMRAQLSELVYYLFSECATIGDNDIFGLCKMTTAGSLSMAWLLVTAAGLGFVLASLTFGLQIPAGIILPSLAIGALYGRALGVIIELTHKHFPQSFVFASCEPDRPCITPATYAIVGAASSLAGVTRMTASIVVIMFELTGALNYVLPIMVAVMLAKWTGDAISSKGIYEAWIHLNEYPYIDNKDDTKIPHIFLSTIMTRIDEVTYIDATRTHTVASLRKLLESTSFRGFPVVMTRPLKSDAPAKLPQVSQQNTLLGYISRTELSYALDHARSTTTTDNHDRPDLGPDSYCYFVYNEASITGKDVDLRPWMDQTPITLNANSTFQLAVSMFQSLGLRYLLLVERGAFRGILTKKDVWWILNASEDARRNIDFVAGTGVFRENITDSVDAQGRTDEARGLLGTDHDDRNTAR